MVVFPPYYSEIIPLSHRDCALNAFLLRSKHVKRQGIRSRVSYSAATTKRHLLLSLYDRLERHATACALSMHKERAMALCHDKHAVETK